jgi:hypothetical protein
VKHKLIVLVNLIVEDGEQEKQTQIPCYCKVMEKVMMWGRAQQFSTNANIIHFDMNLQEY